MEGMEINQVSPGEDATNNPTSKICICERTIQGIICNSCGYVLLDKRLRTRQPCPKHPKLVFHSDLTKCPNCKAGLDDLEEVPFPV